jgi:hypothetical protein
MAAAVTQGGDNLNCYTRESEYPVCRGVSIPLQASLEYWITGFRG